MRRRIDAAVLCAALFLSACGNGGAPASTGPGTTLDPGVPFEVSAGDIQLEARRWGTGNEYVVLAHMRPADMTSWFDFARLLADEGYTAVAFNFRGYGNSGGEEGDFEVGVDVQAVVNAALAAGAQKVFVIGASMGGTGAVAAAAADTGNEIAGTVTLSAPDEFEGLNVAGLSNRIKSPLLLIAADGDGTAADDALAIASGANGMAELKVLSGNQHGTNMFAEHGEEITTLILEFLAAA